MATAEFEELKLSVVLVDEASAGLAALRTAMREFEGDSVRFLKSARDNSEAIKRVGRETDEVVKGLRAKGAMLMRVGTAIGGLTTAYYLTVQWLAKFALEIEQVAKAAQLAGVSYADLRNVAEQMARKGLSPEMGGRILGAVNALGLQLQNLEGIRQWENAMRSSKIALDPKQAEAYIQAMANARGWHERLAIAQNAANNLERNGLEAGLTKAQVAILREEFYVKQGLPRELAITGDIAATTEAQKKKWGKLEDDAKLWTEITHKIIQNVKTILEILNADSMDPDGPFFLMLTTAVSITGYIDKHIGDWIQTLVDAEAWVKGLFTSTPQGETEPQKEGLDPFMLPPGFNPTGGGDDDLPVKLEKLILEFRKLHENLRSGGAPSAPDVVPASFASLGSMATPGLQLPPAAAAGDIYTRQYPQWPGGGGKPYGSDVGPGQGPGSGPQSPSLSASQPLVRPHREGDPQYPGEPKYKSKGSMISFPALSPGLTPLAPASDYNKTGNWESGVSEGTGKATHFSRAPTGGTGKGGVWGDPSDPAGSAALGRLPDRLQGISLSSKETLGQFFEVTDPNTGLTHVMQQTDVGPGVRTQTLVDISANKALQMGYNQKSFEAQQNKLPWTVRNAGFGSAMGPERPGPRQGVEGSATQKLLRQDPHNLASGGDIDAGMANYFGIGAKSGMDIAGDIPDRSEIDRGMGNEMGGKLEGGANFAVDVKAPAGTEVTTEHSGVFNSSEVNREVSFGAD